MSLVVYAVMGRAVARLIDRDMGPGRHEVVFDSERMASGVYFYRFTARDFTAVRRMVVTR